jgi:MoxR-like ATPase
MPWHACLGLKFSRIQFTSDLLPADITGVSIYERDRGTFRFLPGPVFSQVLLADEINRATPKTQSALLEAMEEQQVTVEGETRALPNPFFVIATQNPAHQIGTFPLARITARSLSDAHRTWLPGSRSPSEHCLPPAANADKADQLSAILDASEPSPSLQAQVTQVHAAELR